MVKVYSLNRPGMQSVKVCSVAGLIRELSDKYCTQWWHTSMDFPHIGRKYERAEKRLRESGLSKFIGNMSAQLRNPPGTEEELEAWRESMKAGIWKAGVDSLGLPEGYMNILFKNGFSEVTDEFVREARNFDAAMKLEDIMQAMRNVWIMNSIQILLGIDVGFTPSVFAYSMLYPYTDNYLDSNEIPISKKNSINKRFRQCLEGRETEPDNSYENSLFRFIGMIEEQYPRREFPEVFESLLGIHNAQERSLWQQSRNKSPYEADILGLSIEKGGSSVLADAFLVKGNLTREEADFMFAFGVFLQLADDLQDVSQDAKNGHMTIFSQTAGKWPLDSITNRLFNFISDVVDNESYYSTREMLNLKDMMKINCTFLMLNAIAKNTGLYSREYIKRLEEYSPFSFRYLRKLYDRLRREYRSLERNSQGLSIEQIVNLAVSPGSKACSAI